MEVHGVSHLLARENQDHFVPVAGPPYANSRSALPMTTSVLPSWTNTAGPIPNKPVVVATISKAITVSET